MRDGSRTFGAYPERLVVDPDRCFPSIERVGRLSCPLLIVAGEQDRVVPASDSRALFSAAPPAFARWRLVPRADHNDPELLVGESLLGAIEELWCATAPETCEVRR